MEEELNRTVQGTGEEGDDVEGKLEAAAVD